MLARAVVLDRRRLAARSRARPRVAGAAASSARTRASCSGRARCDAHAIAISRSSRSGRARTSGSAWIGFAEERRNVTSRGSPPLRRSSARRAPRRRGRCARASTTPPRVTSTWIGVGHSGETMPDGRCPSYRKSRPGCASSTRSSRGRPSSRAGPAHIATLKTFDPPPDALEGRRFAGAERRGKNLLFPTEDGELVLRVHLMSAGRLRYHPAGTKTPKTPMFRLTFARRRRARAHRGRQEEARRRLALHPGGARGGARAPRAGRARARRADARRDPRPRAPPAPSAAPRPARARGHRARARERDPLARTSSRPSSSRPTSATTEVDTLATAIDEDLARALALREGRQGRRRRLPDPRPLRRAVPARATTRSAASPSRSTRSRTARPARRAARSSRTAACRGCCADISGASRAKGCNVAACNLCSWLPHPRRRHAGVGAARRARALARRRDGRAEGDPDSPRRRRDRHGGRDRVHRRPRPRTRRASTCRASPRCSTRRSATSCSARRASSRRSPR